MRGLGAGVAVQRFRCPRVPRLRSVRDDAVRNAAVPGPARTGWGAGCGSSLGRDGKCGLGGAGEYEGRLSGVTGLDTASDEEGASGRDAT